MTVERIRELPLPAGATLNKGQLHVKKGERFFVVSSAEGTGLPYETLVFPADAEGKIQDYLQVAGGVGYSREEAIEELDVAERSWVPAMEREDPTEYPSYSLFGWYCEKCRKHDWLHTAEQLAAPEHVPYRGVDIGTCGNKMLKLYMGEKGAE